MFAPRGGKTFLGATPELLARVERGELFSVALAGSVGRGKTPAEAESLAAELLASTKDRHEHALVVGAIRHGLEPLTAQLDIPNVPGIRRLANIQHLETPIRGKLAAGCGALDVVAALHPTPALGGVPRQPALEFIAANEPTARGWYAAPIGWLDAEGNGTFAVAIRSALVDGDRALLYAGAGIVDGSDPAKEWQETELKFKPLMDALTGSRVEMRQREMCLAQ
jgi:isochorismate synthase